MASYPGSIKTWTPVEDYVDDILASHVNEAYDEIIATQTELDSHKSAAAPHSGHAPQIHDLVDAVNHPAAGLTAGHFLKATGEASYGFAAHGLDKTDIGLSNVSNDAQVKKIPSATDGRIALWDGTDGNLLKVGSYGEDSLVKTAAWEDKLFTETRGGRYIG